MTPSLIKVLIEPHGGLKAAAKALDSTKQEISQIINGHRVNEPLREKLAAFLGMTKEQLFDEEFEAVIAYMNSKRKAA
jgi:plasmid maintenance system antidote protein VapI